MLLKILTVAGLATVEIYAAIPAGFVFGLSPWTIFFASITGGLVGIFVAAFLGDKIRSFFHKKKPTKEAAEKKHPAILKLWNKYGIIGLGFLGTISAQQRFARKLFSFLPCSRKENFLIKIIADVIYIFVLRFIEYLTKARTVQTSQKKSSSTCAEGFFADRTGP